MSENRRIHGEEENDLTSPATDFENVIQELDREQSRIVVRLEMRKFRKPTTVIEGLSDDGSKLKGLAHNLKHALATGGTGKDGIVLLQGDQRERTKEALVKMGYSDSSIEVQ